MADIDYTLDAGVATILINRPEAKNAFTIEMADQWADHLNRSATDDEVRAIVVTGAGRSFCGGGDFGRLAVTRTPIEYRDRLTKHIHRVALAVERLDKPLIAAVNGDAFGAGLDMALMCDFRFAARSARFSGGYILAGLVPGDGGCFFLPRLVGIARALELLLLGSTIGAAQAEQYGMVNGVYDDSELLDAAYGVARQLAARPPALVQTIKRCVYQSASSDLRTSLDLVAAQMAVIRSTPESQEAFAAFLDSRRAR